MVEQILSKYLTNIEHVWCVVVLHCFVSSRAQCPIWSHDDVDGANGRFQANLEDLEAECLTNVPYLSIPDLSLPLSPSLSSGQASAHVSLSLGLVPYVLRDHLASAGQGLHPATFLLLFSQVIQVIAKACRPCLRKRNSRRNLGCSTGAPQLPRIPENQLDTR